jgi:hypothetical protein
MECIYISGRSDNAIKNRWHLLKRSSKLAATMQGSNPSSVVTLSSIPSSRVDEDQSMKQSLGGSLFHDIKVLKTDTTLCKITVSVVVSSLSSFDVYATRPARRALMMMLSHHRSAHVVVDAIRTTQRGWKWNAAEVSTRLVLIDTTHELTFALCYVIISHSLLLPSSLRQMSLYMSGCWTL